MAIGVRGGGTRYFDLLDAEGGGVVRAEVGLGVVIGGGGGVLEEDDDGLVFKALSSAWAEASSRGDGDGASARRKGVESSRTREEEAKEDATLKEEGGRVLLLATRANTDRPKLDMVGNGDDGGGSCGMFDSERRNSLIWLLDLFRLYVLRNHCIWRLDYDAELS